MVCSRAFQAVSSKAEPYTLVRGMGGFVLSASGLMLQTAASAGYGPSLRAS